VDDLKELQVLDEEEELTALGHLVADLDMDPCFGKMVVLGICLDPMLILASLGWNALPLPRGLTGPIHLGRTVGYHVATIESFRAIREMLRKGEPSAFMDEVSKDNMSKLYHTVTPKIERIIKTLIAAKLLPADSLYGDRGFYSGSDNFNAGSRDNTLIRTLLLQCLSSNLTVKPFREKTIKYKSGKTAEKGKGLIKSRDRSFIMVSNFGWPYGTERITRVSPLAACVFGNKVEQEEDGVILDSWVRIKLRTVENTENEVAKSLVQTHRVLNEVSISLWLFNSWAKLEPCRPLKLPLRYSLAKKGQAASPEQNGIHILRLASAFRTQFRTHCELFFIQIIRFWPRALENIEGI
jgi:HrpA-like RNA helicase